MTKFTKERLEEIAELARKATYKPCAMHMTNLLAVCDSEVIEEMARQLLASMEQEPVAYMHHSGQVVTREECCDDEIFAICCKVETPLYAAPQLPQPAVPDMAAVGEMPFLGTQEKAFVSGWNAYRAAMLQGSDGTLTNEGTITATQFKPVADLYGLTSPTGGETSFTFDAVEARDFVDGGWSCQEYVELERFQEAVSGNSPVIQGCSCLTCRPVTFSDSRFVVCPECGNKRCPHANDHRNACTGSNEPGQEGSAYPAAPQQEVKAALEHGMQRYAGAMQKLSEGDN